MMNRLFIRNLILVIAINLLIKPVYIFGIDRVVQNIVGPVSYGLFFSIFNFTYLFQVINDFGLQNFNQSIFSKYDFLIGKYLPKMLGAKLVLGFAYTFIIILLAWIIGYRLTVWYLLLPITLNQILVSFLQFFRTNVSAKGYYHLDSFLSVADKLVMIIVCGYLIFISSLKTSFRIEWFIYAQTLSLIVSVAIAIIVLSWIKKDQVRVYLNWDFTFFRWVLKKSVPFALVWLFMTLYTRIDAVMIERLLDDGEMESGIYAASYRVLDAASMIGVLFAGLLLPMFSKLIHRGQRVNQLVRLSISLIWTFAVIVFGISILFPYEIIGTLYIHANYYWGEVYQILMVSILPIAGAYVYGTLLTANESLRLMNRIFFAGVIVNLILNFYFIEIWGAWGAALTTLITQSAVVISLCVVAVRETSLQISISMVLIKLSFAVITILIGLLMMRLPIPWVGQLSLFLLASIITAVLLRQIPLKQLVSMLSSED